MLNKNILKDKLGYYKKKVGDITVNAAVKTVENKFDEIAKALDLRTDSIFKLDNFGVPFVGYSPSVLYDKDSKKLKNIKPINLPTTFFITGDAMQTEKLSAINKMFKPYDDLGMPNSHKLGQGLICRILMDDPVYIHGKPLIPIGIDNHIFVSPKDILKRLEVIRVYKMALESEMPRSKRKELRRAIKFDFLPEARKSVKVNKDMVREFARIFKNQLGVNLTIEPPSSITNIGSILSLGNPLAVVQVEYGVHPVYFDLFNNYYYLYLSDDPLNVNNTFPKNSRKNVLVGPLPYIEDFIKMPFPAKSNRKKIVLSSGGAAGRISRMANELNRVKFASPVEFILLTGVNRKSKEFIRLKNKYKKLSSSRVRFTPIPRTGVDTVTKVYRKSHASIALPGTFSALGGVLSGRPFGAIIDSRTTEDRIFTDHMIVNAYFARDGFKYPVVIIKDSIKKNDIRKLIDDDFLNAAYKRATEKNGIRDIFIKTKKKWRDIFVYFLK